MFNRLLIAICAVTLIAGNASSQEKGASHSPMVSKPSAAGERSRLAFLVGSFTTETTIPASPALPKGASGKGTSVISWALDSMFLFIDEKSENSLFGKYKSYGMLGYDPQGKQFVLSMFNNGGDRPSYNGNFSGDTLVLQTRVQMPGHPFDQKILWYRDGTMVKLKVLNDVGKGFTLSIDEISTPVTGDLK